MSENWYDFWLSMYADKLAPGTPAAAGGSCINLKLWVSLSTALCSAAQFECLMCSTELSGCTPPGLWAQAGLRRQILMQNFPGCRVCLWRTLGINPSTQEYQRPPHYKYNPPYRHSLTKQRILYNCSECINNVHFKTCRLHSKSYRDKNNYSAFSLKKDPVNSQNYTAN